MQEYRKSGGPPPDKICDSVRCSVHFPWIPSSGMVVQTTIGSTMKFFILCIAILSLLSCGCNYDHAKPTYPDPPSWHNLIRNSTFEGAGLAAFHGWIYYDSVNQSASDSVPPGFSGHSVVMHINGFHDRTGINSPISFNTGKYAYRFSVWARLKGTRFRANPGWYQKYVGDPYDVPFHSLTITDSNWNFYSRLDSIEMHTGDSLTVTLACARTINDSGTVWFYNPMFEIMK
jgi:hypothetical protein